MSNLPTLKTIEMNAKMPRTPREEGEGWRMEGGAIVLRFIAEPHSLLSLSRDLGILGVLAFSISAKTMNKHHGGMPLKEKMGMMEGS